MPVKKKPAKRNYTRERLNETKARKEARKARGRARTAMGLKDGDPRVVGHKKPLSKGGAQTKKSNLRIETKKQSNRQGARMVPKAAAARGGRRSKRK